MTQMTHLAILVLLTSPTASAQAPSTRRTIISAAGGGLTSGANGKWGANRLFVEDNPDDLHDKASRPTDWAAVQVSLSRVLTVRVFNTRHRQAGPYLGAFSVWVGYAANAVGPENSTQQCGAWPGPTAKSQIYEINCTNPILGTWVTIQKVAPGEMWIGQIEVDGLDAESPSIPPSAPPAPPSMPPPPLSPPLPPISPFPSPPTPCSPPLPPVPRQPPLSPPLSPVPRQPPLSPPLPPVPRHPPLSPGMTFVASVEQLRAATSINASAPGSSAVLVLPPAGHFALNGMPLSIPAGADVTITSYSDGPPAIIDGGNLSRIVQVFGRLLLNRVVLTGGRVIGNGAGVLVEQGASVVLQDSDVISCVASTPVDSVGAQSLGAGLYAAAGAVVELRRSAIRNCSVSARGKLTEAFGGGMHSQDANMTLVESRVESCTAYAQGTKAAACGGGLSAAGPSAHVTIVRCLITRCSSSAAATESDERCIVNAVGTVGVCDSTAQGGGVFASARATIRLLAATISECVASSVASASKVSGGAIFAGSGSAVYMLDGVVARCTATCELYLWTSCNVRGGGVYAEDANFTLHRSVIRDNTALGISKLDQRGPSVRGGGLSVHTTADCGESVSLSAFDSTITTCAVVSRSGRPGTKGGGVDVFGGVSILLMRINISECSVTAIGQGEELKASGGGLATDRIESFTMMDVSIVSCSCETPGTALGAAIQIHGYLERVLFTRVHFESNWLNATGVMRGTIISSHQLFFTPDSHFTNVSAVGHARAALITSSAMVPWVCPVGTWMQRSGVVDATDFVGCSVNCAVGHFGNSTNLGNPACTGECPPGHECPRGTHRPQPCAPGYYAPEGGSAACTRRVPPQFEPSLRPCCDLSPVV